MTSRISKQIFGKLPTSESVDINTLTNASGMEARIMSFGAILVTLKVPDRRHRAVDVMLGFDTFEYFSTKRYFGTTVGRYANRIANARFTLD